MLDEEALDIVSVATYTPYYAEITEARTPLAKPCAPWRRFAFHVPHRRNAAWVELPIEVTDRNLILHRWLTAAHLTPIAASECTQSRAVVADILAAVVRTFWPLPPR